MMGDTGYADPYAPGGMRRPGAQQVDPYSPPASSAPPPISSQPPNAGQGQQDMMGVQSQGILQMGQQQQPKNPAGNPLGNAAAMSRGSGGSVLGDIAQLIPAIVAIAGA